MKEDFLFSLEVERELMKSKRIINLIVHVAIFGALAIILYCVPYLQFSLPSVPLLPFGGRLQMILSE